MRGIDPLRDAVRKHATDRVLGVNRTWLLPLCGDNMSSVLARNLAPLTSTTFAHRSLPGVVVAANADLPFDEAEWVEFVDSVKSMGSNSRINVLVHSRGSGPNAMQRARLNIVAQTHKIRVAVLTDSVASRAAIMAVGWLARVEVKGFATDDVAGACRYLELPTLRHPDVKHALEAVKRSLRI